MALKIVTGGTTGAADGTLVSGGNPIVFTAIDTPIDAHVRADDDTYGAGCVFSMLTAAGPAVGKGDLQVSFDGGSTWYGWSDNPIAYSTGLGSDIGDLNLAIKLRQHAASPPGDTSGSFDTDGTLASATALSDVGSFAAASASPTSIGLTWAAVTNRTAYRIDRATNSGFTTGVALDISPGQTGTSFTDTGLTTGTTYYYRIKAVGTYRYKDSANFATANSVAGTLTTVTFNPSNDGMVRYYPGSTWQDAHDQAAGTDAYPTSTSSAFGASYNSLNLVARGFLTFDSSSLPDGAVLASGKVKVWVNSVVGSEGSLYLVDGTQAAGAIAVAAYNKAGSTPQSDTHPNLSGMATGAYLEFPLNAAGLAAVNKTGDSKFAGRHSSDLNNARPATDCSVLIGYVEDSTAGHRPVLEVTYYA